MVLIVFALKKKTFLEPKIACHFFNVMLKLDDHNNNNTIEIVLREAHEKINKEEEEVVVR